MERMTEMVNKVYCMSSYLGLRYVEKENMDFCKNLKYKRPYLLPEKEKILIYTPNDIHNAIIKQLEIVQNHGYRKLGILLSGGMDSAILASYLTGSEAYTFRFENGNYQGEELKRAEYYAKYYGLHLHYVDISWDAICKNLIPVIQAKGGPVHSIEPQIYQAAVEAKKDGVDLMIIGDGSDYVFGGMDGLLSQDWTFDAFWNRYIYIEPSEVLRESESLQYLFERYRDGNGIDFQRFLDVVATEESYGSYANAFEAASLEYFDPYERMRMAEPLDLNRVRAGESKYFIRELFSIRYPTILVPEKLPMPRMVDEYFKNWEGPKRKEFKENIDISRYSGNQRWLLWCLEQFLDLYDE